MTGQPALGRGARNCGDPAVGTFLAPGMDEPTPLCARHFQGIQLHGTQDVVNHAPVTEGTPCGAPADR